MTYDNIEFGKIHFKNSTLKAEAIFISMPYLTRDATKTLLIIESSIISTDNTSQISSKDFLIDNTLCFVTCKNLKNYFPIKGNMPINIIP